MKQKVLEAIKTELGFQQNCAIRKNWKKSKTPIEYAVLMEAEIDEAKRGYCKNDTSNFGRNTTEHEILQVVCLGLEMLESLSDAELQKLIDSTLARIDHEVKNGL